MVKHLHFRSKLTVWFLLGDSIIQTGKNIESGFINYIESFINDLDHWSFINRNYVSS